MAIKFGNTKGEAIKADKVDYYKFTEGENAFRMVGDILARYVYWRHNINTKKPTSVECLSFDRDQEKFTNVEKDWYNHYFPEDKCAWAYLVRVVDLEDGKVKTLGLKKKLFAAILELAEEEGYGDPTDVVSGFDIVVGKKKTGPNDFNVEYTLKQLKCKKRPLTPEELKAVEEAGTIDKVHPRPSPEEQKAFIEKVFIQGTEEKVENTVDTDTMDDLKELEDDIPQ